MESALYFGTLRHRRFRPVPHEFHYNLFMAFLDIDRIPEVMSRSLFSSYNRTNWASFQQRDHFGDPRQSLRQRLMEDAAAQGITLPTGPIFLLTHLRYLGYNFNPISLFYCFDSKGTVTAILAEVNSTFGERHNYWLSSANQMEAHNSLRFKCPKAMHVSPFLGMDLSYDFALTPPNDHLVAHMSTIDDATATDGALFDATLTLERRPWTAPELRRGLLRHPWMTAKVIGAIHWQALRLYRKGVPVYSHPAKLHAQAEDTRRKTVAKDA
ncbi:MAG: DUF1365 domain-containing protein [Acidobacteriota bacterium]